MNASLFRRDLVVAVLSSGSKGNCTYIGDHREGVLIDCGVSTKQIQARMQQVGLEAAHIRAVLVTHEHDDHVGAARVLSGALAKRQGQAVPFLMTAGTADGIRPPCMPDGVERVTPGARVAMGPLQLECFSVPHDTTDPVGWRVGIGGTWAGVITDLGKPTPLVLDVLRSLAVVVLEFNHDEELLMTGGYPWPLKQRIRSNKGHLSNHQAAELLHDGVHDGLSHVILAHLSGENNTPAHAQAAAWGALRRAGALGQVAVQVAMQTEALPPVVRPTAGW